jgi:hypothetical protein
MCVQRAGRSEADDDADEEDEGAEEEGEADDGELVELLAANASAAVNGDTEKSGTSPLVDAAQAAVPLAAFTSCVAPD